MSDPSNPYGSGGATPYGAQPAYGQAPVVQQPAYGTQPAYGAQTSYGAGASYGQPMYGQVVYALNPAVERVRSNASMVRIMSFVSFVTVGPLLSFGAWFWSMNLLSEAESLGAPEDVLRDVRGAGGSSRLGRDRSVALLRPVPAGRNCPRGHLFVTHFNNQSLR